MKVADQSHRFVRWSAEEQVYAELCSIFRDEVEHREQRGEVMPRAAVRVIPDVELVTD